MPLFPDISEGSDDNNQEENLDDCRKELSELIDEFIVTPDTWCKLHPSGPKPLTCGSDKYYAQLATMLKVIWMRDAYKMHLPDAFLHVGAITLATYLEDIVSGIGV